MKFILEIRAHIQLERIVTFIIIIPLIHQWAHLAQQVSIVACRVNYWARWLVSFLPQYPAYHHLALGGSMAEEGFPGILD